MMHAYGPRLLLCAGRAAWLDKDKSRAMILWKTHAEWAETIYSWAHGFGLNDSVLAIDDLSTSDDVEGTGSVPHMLLLLNIIDTEFSVWTTLANTGCSSQNWRDCRARLLSQHSKSWRRRDWPGEAQTWLADSAAI